MLTARFLRYLVLINLFLTVASIVSYAATIYSIAQWIHWEGQQEGVGGVLDYKAFGESTLYHVTLDNQRGQRFFSFYDFTAYLTTGAIVFLAIDLAIRTLNRTEPEERQRLAGFSLIVAFLCILSYRSTMFTISGKNTVLSYAFPFLMNIGGLYRGQFESSSSLSLGDYTSWLFLVLLVQTCFLTYMQLSN